MQAISIRKYMALGASYEFLRQARAGYPAHGQNHILSALQGFMEGFAEFGLKVTRRAAKQLQRYREELDKLLGNLDKIRESFRNPTQHAEKVYDIDDAQDLFGLCIDVVNRLAKALP